MTKTDAAIYGLSLALIVSACMKIRGYSKKLRTPASSPWLSPNRKGCSLFGSLILPVSAAVAVALTLSSLLGLDSQIPAYVLAMAIVATGIFSTLLDCKTGPILWAEVSAACGICIATAWLISAPAGALELSLPVEGTWKVVSGGKLKLMNHHINNPSSQNYAVDLVTHPSAGASAGQNVFAPVDGTVVRAITGCNQESPCDAEGNLVVIRTGTGCDVWLAHLEENSVTVQENQSVRAGRLIGKCGATGNAEEPHLHVHAQRQDEPVPLKFGSGRWWPIRGDIIQQDGHQRSLKVRR